MKTVAMKTYVGQRFPDGCKVWVKKHTHKRPLRLRLDLFNHSPDGFNWGYSGSGPAQLALAILADCLKIDDLAVRLHQPFKRKMIAGIDVDHWSMTESVVRDTLEAILKEGMEGVECVPIPAFPTPLP